MKAAGAPLDVLTPQHKAARSRLREQADRELVNDTMAQNPTLTVRELADVLGMAPGRVKRLLAPESPAHRHRPVTDTRAERRDALLTAFRAYAKAMA